MATEAQVLANRANARKSTGPRTPEGKAVVSQNAVKHGLLARAAVLQGEDPEEFALYREQLLEELDANGTLEVVLAERAVSLSWRLQRAARNQNAAFEALYDKHTASQAMLGPPEPACGLEPAGPAESGPTLGRMLVEDFAGETVLERLLVYERRIESSLYRTMAELRRLRGQRETARRVPVGRGERFFAPTRGAGSVRRSEEDSSGPWEDSSRHGQAALEPPEDFTLDNLLAALAALEKTPDGVTTNGPVAEAPHHSTIPSFRDCHPAPGGEDLLCETNPISDLPPAEAAAEPVGSVPVRASCGTGILPVDQNHGQDAHATETPDGVTTDAPGADVPTIPSFQDSNHAPAPEDLLCETNPISDLPEADAATEPVGSVPARASCGTGILPVDQNHGQDAHATETPGGVTTNGPVAEAPHHSTIPSFQDSHPAPAPEELLCETKPISEGVSGLKSEVSRDDLTLQTSHFPLDTRLYGNAACQPACRRSANSWTSF